MSLGEAERGGVVDQCLSRINQLSDNVKDAASYLPAYDQRKYSEVRLKSGFPPFSSRVFVTVTAAKCYLPRSHM